MGKDYGDDPYEKVRRPDPLALRTPHMTPPVSGEPDPELNRPGFSPLTHALYKVFIMSLKQDQANDDKESQ